MGVNLAFYGAGEPARPYLDALARRPDVQLVGVCDPDRRAAEQVAAGWNAPVYLDPDALLQEANPDVLWVCVPPSFQGDVLVRAVERRIPFFVPAPGAKDIERARQYEKLIREAKLVTGVGFPAAYTDVAREAREFIGTNPIPLVLGWWLRPTRDTSRPTAASQLWNEACMLIDTLRYLCGEVAEVRGFGGLTPEDIGRLVLHLRFRRGTLGVLTLATFARPEPRVELELSGEGWSLLFEEDLSRLRVAEPGRTTILGRVNSPAQEQVQVFLDAVAAGDPSKVPTGYADALTTLAVCEAAAESVREGRAITLPEV